MDYNGILNDCEFRAEVCRMAHDGEGFVHEMQCKKAITDLIQYKDAIDRMGEFGKLFLQYSGDPRGMIGEAGYAKAGDVIERAKESVMHYETITDVDGNVWRPVLEDRLKFLILCMTERVEKAVSDMNRIVSEEIYPCEVCDDSNCHCFRPQRHCLLFRYERDGKEE